MNKENRIYSLGNNFEYKLKKYIFKMTLIWLNKERNMSNTSNIIYYIWKENEKNLNFL